MKKNRNENEIAKIVVDCCYKIHSTLGPGLLESVYEQVLEYEINKCGLRCDRQVEIPIVYETLTFQLAFRADLIIDNKVIIELKSVAEITDIHKKQLLTYLKLSGKKLGLLINFNSKLIKHGITRIVNNL